jgi:hypothetical protein
MNEESAVKTRPHITKAVATHEARTRRHLNRSAGINARGCSDLQGGLCGVGCAQLGTTVHDDEAVVQHCHTAGLNQQAAGRHSRTIVNDKLPARHMSTS